MDQNKNVRNATLVFMAILAFCVLVYFLITNKEITQKNLGLTQRNNNLPSTAEYISNPYQEDYNLLSRAIDWQSSEYISDWQVNQINSANMSVLDKLQKGRILRLLKIFNEGGSQVDGAHERLNSDVDLIKEALTNNDWSVIAKPDDISYYNDYIYKKDNRPLILRVGSRDAVANGMYVEVQFLYDNRLAPENTELDNLETLTSISDWNTYTNNKHNFAIKYPSNWKLGGPPLGESPEYSDDLTQFRGEKCVVTFSHDGTGRDFEGAEYRAENKIIDLSGNKFQSRYIYSGINLVWAGIFDFPTLGNTLEISPIGGSAISSSCVNSFHQIINTLTIK